jgi:hypothetical protein
LQASETVLAIACSPKNDGIARATKLVGDLQIGWLILGCQAQNESATEDQGLRRRVGAGESLQPILRFVVHDNRRRKWIWHDDILATG